MTSTTVRQTSGMNRQSQGVDQHLNGAALIDTDGREIPITEQMISAALRALETGETYTGPGTSHQNRRM